MATGSERLHMGTNFPPETNRLKMAAGCDSYQLPTGTFLKDPTFISNKPTLSRHKTRIEINTGLSDDFIANFTENFARKHQKQHNKRYLSDLKQELGGNLTSRLNRPLFTKQLPRLTVSMRFPNFKAYEQHYKTLNLTRPRVKQTDLKSIKSNMGKSRTFPNNSDEKSTPTSLENRDSPSKLSSHDSQTDLHKLIRKHSKLSNKGITSKHSFSGAVQLPETAPRLLQSEMSSHEVLYDIEHDWMRNDDYSKRLQKVRQAKRDLDIAVPEDSDNVAIDTRVKEVKRMVKPNSQMQYMLDNMDPLKRDIMRRFENMSTEEVKSERRKTWTKPIDVFRGAATLCANLIAAFVQRKRYCNVNNDAVLPPLKGKGMVGIHPPRSTLREDTVDALTTLPTKRTKSHIHKVLRVLRATKAFEHLFPSELMSNLAAIVGYDRYDDKRVIANQSSKPDRFYFVITGKILLVREYNLDAGVVIKQMGELRKGMTTDSAEMEKQSERELSLVAKGQVEVLVIHKFDYMRLLHNTSAPPLEFLQSVHLFKEFPCERFSDTKDSFECRYYGENQMILSDASDTPWIYVIKSGEVKVVRVQDIHDNRHVIGQAPISLRELEQSKPYSHADAMLGCLAYQRKMKSLIHDTAAEDKQPEPEVTNPLSHTILQRDVTIPTLVIHEAPEEQELTETPAPSTRRASMRPSLPPINIPVAQPQDGRPTLPSNKTQVVFLTRERTEKTFVRNEYTTTANKKGGNRNACLLLDILRTRDVFGIEALVSEIRKKQGLPTKLGEEEGPTDFNYRDLRLVSGGAEVIKINKRFFLQNAANNTMLKIETMQREYMTKDDAKEKLRNDEMWNTYKTLLLERTVTTLDVHRPIKV